MLRYHRVVSILLQLLLRHLYPFFSRNEQPSRMCLFLLLTLENVFEHLVHDRGPAARAASGDVDKKDDPLRLPIEPGKVGVFEFAERQGGISDVSLRTAAFIAEMWYFPLLLAESEGRVASGASRFKNISTMEHDRP